MVGIDADSGQIEAARTSAAEREVDNAEFVTASVYELPFEKATFDVVYANAVLMYVRDQVLALTEMRRVLRPDGLAAVIDDDLGTVVISPDRPELELAPRLFERAVAHEGGNARYSRRLRTLMLEAGFARTQGVAHAPEVYGDLAATRWFAEFAVGLFAAPSMAEVIVGENWATRAELDATIAALREWGELPTPLRPGCTAARSAGSAEPQSHRRFRSRDSKLRQRGSVITLDRPIRPKANDVVADFTLSDDMEKGTFENPDASAPFWFARHRCGQRSRAARRRGARIAVFQPSLGRDPERTILVDPTLLLEASAIRAPYVAASSHVLRCRMLQQPVDAALDRARRRRRRGCGRRRLGAPPAVARSTAADCRGEDQYRQVEAHVRNCMTIRVFWPFVGDIPEC